jgi:hypothetical protein
MDGTQQLVGVGGLALVGVNYWTSQQRPAISGVILGTSQDTAAGHKALLGIGGELLVVGLLTLVAGSSDSMALGMLAAIAALWVLWGIHYYGGQAGAKTTAQRAATSSGAAIRIKGGS